MPVGVPVGVLVLCLLSFELVAAPIANIINPNLTNQRNLVGEIKFSVWLWDIYAAKLYAPNKKLNRNKPFLLKLNYLRDFSGKDIAMRSAEEMTKQGAAKEKTIEKWQKKMADIFPDVLEGDWIDGFRDKKGYSHFFHNKKYIGSVKDKQFTKSFFDIWLGEKTSQPALRRKLLGQDE